jgi:hypothetical protein
MGRNAIATKKAEEQVVPDLMQDLLKRQVV